MSKLIVVLTSCLLFVACSISQTLSPSPPQAAKDAATKAINQSFECKVYKGGCKDIKIICSNRVELSDADRANKVTEKWCMKIRFLFGDENKWNDGESDALLSNAQDKWHAEFLGTQYKRCTCAQ